MGSCILYPEVNGEASKLYKDMLSKINNRPLTNFIYAAYLQQGVAAQMDNQGFRKNKQGQHRAEDVIKYFDVDSMSLESEDLLSASRRIGARDSSDNLVDFIDAKEALEKASQLNSNQAANSLNGLVANVVQHGDKFNIIVAPRDSRTQYRAVETERKLATWQVINQAFSGVGIDLSAFDFNRSFVNALNGENILSWAENLVATRNDLYSQMQVRTLLTMGENTTQVSRLKQKFGSLEEVAAKVYNAYHGGRANYTSAELSLIDSAMNESKKLNGLNLQSLRQQVDQIITDNFNTNDAKIQETIEELNKMYDLDFIEEHLNGTKKEIRSLSEASSEAAITMKRQLRILKSQQGITPEVKDLELSIKRLTREIANRRYYSGILGFLNDATNQIAYMENLYQTASQTPGTMMEKCAAEAKAIMEIKKIIEGYSSIIKSLSNVKSLNLDESISSTDLQSIETQAKTIKKFYEEYGKKIINLRRHTMLNLASEYLGKSTDGLTLANVVAMSEADASTYDSFYSISRVSNPLLATMGSVIRDAQSDRTKKMRDVAIRIRRATNRLSKSKSGSDTSFMYESTHDSNYQNNDYIISDLDWVSYNEARKKARKRLKAKGLRDLALEEAFEQWEENNTEDRIVDFKSGRTERVPNAMYRKAMPVLSQEQLEYYTEMMQIKGEMGTLMPKWAQKQYLPPQRRRTFVDAFVKSRGNPVKIAKAILNKVLDWFVVREDDSLNAQNNVFIEGEEYGIKSGALDNTPYRQIPIFYVNRLKDQGELLKDFSGALQGLAGSAINYECMHNIQDTVEMMGDFIKEQGIPARDRKGKKLVDVVEGNGIKIFKNLVTFGNNTNTAGLVDGFIDKHIYGIKLKEIKSYTKLVQTLLAYTSTRSLTVNLKGMISNYLMGELQMLIEAGAGEFYNPVDYAWAHAKVFGDNTVNALPHYNFETGDFEGGRAIDYLSNNVNSMSVLLAQRFDPINEEFGELSHERYFSGPLRKMVAKDFTFIGYGMGEHLTHFVTMYAVLHNTKVRIDGKDKRLSDAFEKGNKEDGNSELLLKKNVTYKDENGNWVVVDDAFLDKIRDRIRYCNQTCHGSMNEEDKGLIHQKMVGRFVMNLRQWMVEHYSRRYRSNYWDASLKEWREGYYNTVGKFLLSWGKALRHLEFESAIHWKDMTLQQKANVRRAFSEQLIIGSLMLLSFALGEPEEHKKEFWMRMWIYQTKRALMDMNASTPASAKGLGLPQELTKMVKNPIAATSTINSTMYVLTGLPDINEEIKGGKHKGENKYYRYMKKYWLPYYNHIEQIQNMSEDEAMFAMFHNDFRQ